ncbi:MAG: aminotransferase class III-fold pyridoxal phosphate-dependent enzyme, partial [Akkermansia sp.]
PYNDREAVKKAFELHGRDIAAVILEPFPANAGLYFPQNGFLHFLRKITRQYDSLLIFDEVMTGFRVAPGGVQQLHGITPDLTCMGKVIGGGLPVGAFGGRAEIMDCLSPLGSVYQAGTLSGNPVAMAAGLAQLRELLEGNAYDRLEQLGARLEAGIREAIRKHGRNYTFHRAGSMFCLFFTEEEVYDLDTAQKASKALFKPFFWNMLEQGVYFAPSPYETGFISLAHTEEDIDRTVEAVHASLSRLG